MLSQSNSLIFSMQLKHAFSANDAIFCTLQGWFGNVYHMKSNEMFQEFFFSQVVSYLVFELWCLVIPEEKQRCTNDNA